MDFILTNGELREEIQKIEQTYQKKSVVYTHVIAFCQNILEDYRKRLRCDIFENTSAEIRFFKEHKQLPSTQLIFYLHIQWYELELTRLPQSLKRKEIIQKIERLNKFFLSHIDFVQYIELDEDYMDEFYFTRKFNGKKLHSIRNYDRDPEFSTSHDLLLSELKAQKLFLLFLHSKLLEMDHPLENPILKVPELQWTSSKVALIELIYALYHSGTINNGQISLKVLVARLEKILNIELGDYHHTFLRLRGRTEPLKFIEKLRNNLFERMQEMDE